MHEELLHVFTRLFLELTSKIVSRGFPYERLAASRRSMEQKPFRSLMLELRE
jgi:hypothetical protein